MSVQHMNPFDQSFNYRNASWFGTLPLPYKKKEPPPTSFTGHKAPHPSTEQIQDWINEGRRNICIRLAGVDEQHEIIGIDVDHYKKGDKDKRGFDQLEELEIRLGDLPETWISSSRTDGKSGIRYFRVPRGMAFRGQVDKDIECISKGYRYAIVWPSVHDELGSTYWWFPPGTVPDKPGRKVWENGHSAGTAAFRSMELPDARLLPLLPKPWLEYLTQGGMRATDQRIDMDSSLDEIYVWSDETFHGDDDTEMCPFMREKLDKLIKKIRNEATSHDKITNGHWNLVRLAQEGHLGWAKAVNELEQTYLDEVIKRNKRGDEVKGEIFRSRAQALRKIKGDCDERVNAGAAPIDARCDRMGGLCSTSAPETDPSDPLAGIPTGGNLRPGDQYELNDDGNAQHFVDYFSDKNHGPSVRFAEGFGWIIWHDGDNPHWEIDKNGDQDMRRMWQKVKQRQLFYVEGLLAVVEQETQNWNFNGPKPISLKAAEAAYTKWKNFVEKSGNNRNAEAAIEAVKSIHGISIDLNTLDANPHLLGVQNGVVELTDNPILRKMKPEDYVTRNTNVPYEHPSDLAKNEWKKYLDSSIPDPELQRVVQIILGHCIVGGNPENKMIFLKGAPRTGKSTMVDALLAAMGDYGSSANNSIFQNHKLNPILADTLTQRIVVCSEMGEEDKLSVSMIKRITGEDMIRVEIKNSNAKLESYPQFVPVIPTNEVPKIPGSDKALEIRLIVIPFNHRPKHIKAEVKNIIKTVAKPAILEWLIEGYREYRRVGKLPTHAEIEKQTKSFVAELDDVATFASQCLVAKENSVIPIANMFNAYDIWCIETKIQPKDRLDSNAFSRRMKALGWITKNSRFDGKVMKCWQDVKVVQYKDNILDFKAPSLTVVSDAKE